MTNRKGLTASQEDHLGAIYDIAKARDITAWVGDFLIEVLGIGLRRFLRWLVVGMSVGFLLAGSVLGAESEEPYDKGRAGRETMGEGLERLERMAGDQQARIESLQRQIASKDSASPDAARAEEVERIVREVMSDAEFRKSLYPDITQVGYDEGFYIKSGDEAFLLNITGMMQVRWTGLNRQTDTPRLPGRNKQDDINGFEIQWLVLSFDGHIHDSRLTYLIQVIGDTDQAHSWQTYYASISYELAKELVVSAGILDIPQGFNNLIADSKQLFVDRSVAEEVFNPSYTLGVMASGLLFDRLEYAAGIFNGIGNSNDSPSREQLDTNFAYAASLIYHLMGDGVGDDETDLAFSKDPLWDVGVNFVTNDDNGDNDPTFIYTVPDRVRRGRGIGGYGEVDMTGTDMVQFGAHTAFRYRGFSFTTEWYLRTVDGDDERSDWELLTGRSDATHFQGGYVEAGYFVVPKKVEVAARLGGVWDTGGDNTWEYTFGVNYYPYQSHNFKIQADYTRIEEAPITTEYGNWFQNDDVDMVRVSLQVAF